MFLLGTRRDDESATSHHHTPAAAARATSKSARITHYNPLPPRAPRTSHLEERSRERDDEEEVTEQEDGEVALHRRLLRRARPSARRAREPGQHAAAEQLHEQHERDDGKQPLARERERARYGVVVTLSEW